ncbi:MAG TPA: type II secretory pathway, component PulD [Opitutales bacterium]|nr:type II secretory pathway, component PulD [Opitutales bacterium]
MSDALAARDAGDPKAARDYLQQLAELDPSDQGVQRLLANVEESIAEQEVEMAQAELASAAARQSEDLRVRIDDAQALRDLAREQVAQNEFSVAIQSLELAREELPQNPQTESLHREIDQQLSDTWLNYAQYQLHQGDRDGARASIDAAKALDTPGSQDPDRLAKEALNPAYIPIDEASPGFVENQEEIREMLRIGRAQYLNGDILGAESTFRNVEAIDVYNSEAKAMLGRIAKERQRRNHLDRSKTRAQMLEEVGSGWQRPQVYVEKRQVEQEETAPPPLMAKLENIQIPNVSFPGVELSYAINSLSQASQEYDPEGTGVNIVLIDPDRIEPMVYIDVRDLSLKRILDLMLDSVKFRYDVEEDAVIVRPGVRRSPDLELDNFPVSPATVQRLIGSGGGTSSASSAEINDPFAAPSASTTPETSTGSGEAAAIQNFLEQSAGVDFSIPGSTLMYDGTYIWVTQTQRNLERVRNVFRRLTDVRQVEIEARFLEVTQSNLDELGFDWTVTSPGGSAIYQSSNRTLGQAFAGGQGTSEIRIGDQSFPLPPPQVPGGPDLGSGSNDFATIRGVIDNFDVNATIRMLAQQRGSDLLSAPKVTVLSGYEAEIVVAQELRYPDTYGDTQSEVGRGGTGDGGAAGVTITPGTPQDFQTRNVGVELRVTPTVEQDDSVTLELNPRVTEFQGFVEYGGLSVAVTANDIVTNPSGFYQPIFASREVLTTVNVWDGATVVMGGLVREEVKRVNDKVPFFGDIPVVGRLFRSEGEASEKRNLLIFVTANLVSPGGSPMRQQVRSVEPGALFQNPTLVLPSGAVSREKREE